MLEISRVAILRGTILSLALLLPCLAIPSPAAAADKEKSCIECHKKFVSKRVVHQAITQFARMEQGCPSCHAAPHGNQKAEKSLKEKAPGLCYQCHNKDLFSRSIVHPPVASGDCLACHDPHATDNNALLRQPLPFLCQSCHDDEKDGKHILGGYGLGDSHPIQGRKDPSRIRRELTCTSCHSPHSSSYPYLFTAEAKNAGALCAKCHSRVIVRP